MGTTTGSALRYPEPSDPVAQGATAIKNLADDVDLKMIAKAGDTGLAGSHVWGLEPFSGEGSRVTVNNMAIARTSAAGSTPTDPNLYLGRGGTASAANAQYVTFRASPGASGTPMATVIGSITSPTTSTIAYNTSSDPRLKSAGQTRGIDDAAERARILGASAWRGQWLADETGETWDFLSSHDVEDVASYAVTGGRDDVDEDGNPVYQQVSYQALVPLLFAALADALDRIAILETATTS